VPVERITAPRPCWKPAADLRAQGVEVAVDGAQGDAKAIGDLWVRPNPRCAALSNNRDGEQPRLPVIGATKT